MDGVIFLVDKFGLFYFGFMDEGYLIMYYLDFFSIIKDEIDVVVKWMQVKGLFLENIRFCKIEDGVFELFIVFVIISFFVDGGDVGKEVEFVISEGFFEGKIIKLVYGDYFKEMVEIIKNIKKVVENVENEIQVKMYIVYVKFFEEGFFLVFKDFQRYWVKD